MSSGIIHCSPPFLCALTHFLLHSALTPIPNLPIFRAIFRVSHSAGWLDPGHNFDSSYSPPDWLSQPVISFLVGRTSKESFTARSFLTLCLSALIALTGGCAPLPSSVITPPFPKIEAMASRQAEGFLLLGADPWVQLEQQKSVFDADLTKLGVLPVQIFLENRGDQKLRLHRSDTTLELPEGNQISRTPGPDVAELTRPKPGAAGMLYYVMAFSFPVTWFLLPLPIVLFIAERKVADRTVATRLVDYQGKELGDDIILADRESAHGFVFFQLPSPMPKEATLVLRLVNVDDGTSIVARLPLSRLVSVEDTTKPVVFPND